MKKLLFTLMAILGLITIVIAQNRDCFKYQAVVRDNQGLVLVNESVSIKISILQGTETGSTVYSEEHAVNTNAFGLIGLNIGCGSQILGDFNNINWGSIDYFLNVEVDPQGGTNYESLGTSQLFSVPLALHAQTVDNSDDDDADPLNEIQDINLIGTDLSISGGSTVDLSSIQDGYEPNTDNQTLTLINDSIVISNGNGIPLPNGLNLWASDGKNVFLPSGNLGLGTISPTGKLEIKGNAVDTPDDLIFGVMNNNGDTVFAVYQEGVRVNVNDDNLKAAGSRGGFAVGGISGAKGFTNEFFRVTPDSVRIYIDNRTVKATGSRGGFAVGGISGAKSTPTNFMYLEPDNYFIGFESGKSIANGLYNSFLGYQTGYSTNDGGSNVFLGYKSGYSNTLGNSNVFIGNESGYKNTTGASNVFLGFNAGYTNNANNNVFLGYQSGLRNSTGDDNVFLGTSSGYTNTTGASNVFIGNEAGRTNSTGVSNVFLGYWAGYANTASNNVFLGNEAGRNNTSGTNNAFMGFFAGRANISGSNNVYLGNNTALSNTSGTGNVAIGNNCASDVTAILNSSVILGENALTGMITNIPVSSSLFIGKNAGIGLGTGSTSVSNCIFLGTNAGEGVRNTEYSSISSIVAVGNYSGSQSNGYRNVFLGNSAGFQYVGHQSTMIGFNVAQRAEGVYNVYLGDQCALDAIGDNNTYIGRTAGTWVTGSNNVFLGYNAGAAPYSSPRTESSRLRIGSSNLIYGEFDNKRVVINGVNTDNPSNYTFYVNGTAGGDYAWNNLSDIRLKKNINTINGALEKVMLLRGVNFEWIDPNAAEKGLRMGFIAQEAEKVIPEVVNKEGEFYAMQYAPITAVLVEAIKEQQKKIQTLEEKVREIDTLKAELEAIKVLLKK